MSEDTLHCLDDQRRDQVRQHRDEHGQRDRNGLDYVEVAADQRSLTVYFLGKAPRQLLRREGERAANYQKRLRHSVIIEGGRRVRDIRVLDVDIHQATDPRTGKPDPERDDDMLVRVDQPGDFSTYTLRLVNVDDIDPRYDRIEFTFKAGCVTDLDCGLEPVCPPPDLAQPAIDYLAKDYASFRQLILDRLSLIMPDWRERHIPDLGITLVEILAYAGDYLSYYQDAVATEAYLDTARQRISVRRHARLVDYRMHEGCNARAWLCVQPAQDLPLKLDQVYFITGLNNALSTRENLLTEDEVRRLPAGSFDIFEPLAHTELQLYEAHNTLNFYTWDQQECCLPAGTTRATLRYDWLPVQPPPPNDQGPQQVQAYESAPRQEPAERKHLMAGDVLIFEEVVGPKTGQKADADLRRRHAVRLTKVDYILDRLHTPAVPLAEIEWAEQDALPFALCLSSIGPAPKCELIENVSVAHGNVILVDHGQTVRPDEPLGQVPTLHTEMQCECVEHPGDVSLIPGRYRPHLRHAPLTYSQPLPVDDASQPLAARQLLRQDARLARPAVQLHEIEALLFDDQPAPLFEWSDLRDPTQLITRLRDPGDQLAQRVRRRLSRHTARVLTRADPKAEPSVELVNLIHQELLDLVRQWEPRYDLLGSGPDDRNFVVEIDNDGVAQLRFGDGELGEQPGAGSLFAATYRVGNGTHGNVGADAISHMVLRYTLEGVKIDVRNPLPATGGTDAEPVAEVKLYAPSDFKQKLARAIIADDYARLAELTDLGEPNRKVQRAAASLVWTGSWAEAEVTIDASGGQAGRDLLDDIERRLYVYRRIGHDLRVGWARRVPLDIALTVCVKPDYLRGHVKAALLDVFSNRSLPGGRSGFFHPDRLTFGEGVYLSQLVAAAQAVTGVESVRVTRLQRLFEAPNHEIERGLLPLGPLEVAQLDNDPSFPEHGRLSLDVQGGR